MIEQKVVSGYGAGPKKQIGPDLTAKIPKDLAERVRWTGHYRMHRSDGSSDKCMFYVNKTLGALSYKKITKGNFPFFEVEIGDVQSIIPGDDIPSPKNFKGKKENSFKCETNNDEYNVILECDSKKEMQEKVKDLNEWLKYK
mmetsp:Transcript_24792/g.21995  ORF Transcript_24792/g.21995 Transcript_24792/m.21995 type:complete len:142 (-) Transcript_24792:217-642(-)|eukprot:CAMPEP_0114586490 /NCGR_PEP_ID=MMETSP0125-20121206/9697_1 /TAXON_ID=485358 ORGANISM="Aristerostoma sp., Strain ATCC 50986" /NCGR_SAMPLE_ID=MMETSP0125 /ASSEMBLY_ACC=CAM_ASM_000245 /LENGTH=141 /DNA_ID=CAMNT_0001781947 /DNA_START=180 /DNA_END=605 /DNA_ORIENTATION=+